MSEVLFLTMILGLLHPVLGLNILDLFDLQNVICGSEHLEASEDSVKILLAKQCCQSEDCYYVLKVGDIDNLNASPFDPTRKTIVIIHGWTGQITSPRIVEICKAYLDYGGYNIILIDWYPLSWSLYPLCVQCCKSIGRRVGKMLQFLNTKGNLSYCNVHIIGHSLGAHIGGFAGAEVFGAVGRITGLDPAGPCIEIPFLVDPAERLDPSDAVFVDVIHTSGGTFGFMQPMGHADFYPNEGTAVQPGCLTELTKLCSHARAMEYMANSVIHRHGFFARKCDSWNDYKANKCDNEDGEFMGEACSLSARGVYYSATNSTSPYC